MTRRRPLLHLATEMLNSGNQKPFWRWLKSLSDSKQGIPQLKHNAKINTSDFEKANVLGDYFWSVYTIEKTHNLKQAVQRLQVERNPESLDTVMFTPEDVFNELCRTNPAKPCGPHQLPGGLLKEGALWIAKPLSELFARSMALGILPDEWTTANVTPIYMNSDMSSPSNYRPISLTSCEGCRIIHVASCRWRPADIAVR